MATTRKPKPLPVPTAPIVDPATGRPTQAFYEFLAALIAWAKEADASL